MNGQKETSRYQGRRKDWQGDRQRTTGRCEEASGEARNKEIVDRQAIEDAAKEVEFRSTQSDEAAFRYRRALETALRQKDSRCEAEVRFRATQWEETARTFYDAVDQLLRCLRSSQSQGSPTAGGHCPQGTGHRSNSTTCEPIATFLL